MSNYQNICITFCGATQKKGNKFSREFLALSKAWRLFNIRITFHKSTIKFMFGNGHVFYSDKHKTSGRRNNEVFCFPGSSEEACHSDLETTSLLSEKHS